MTRRGDVHLFGLSVGRAGQLGDLVRDIHDRVDVKQALDVLTDDRKTLQTHAGVDVLLLQLGIVALTVVVELGEYVVPDLDIAVALAADLAIGLAAAVLRAAVIIDLGAQGPHAGRSHAPRSCPPCRSARCARQARQAPSSRCRRPRRRSHRSTDRAGSRPDRRPSSKNSQHHDRASRLK